MRIVAPGRGAGTGSTSERHHDPSPQAGGEAPVHDLQDGVPTRGPAREIALALGVKPVTVSTPTWIDQLYSCRYEYSTGVMTLSVKELSSWAQTFAYFRGLGSRYGTARSLGNLGQGAFSETDGSVVVRKDWKVLTVDITGLPGQFGVPPSSSADIAVTVADVILGCWAGD